MRILSSRRDEIRNDTIHTCWSNISTTLHPEITCQIIWPHYMTNTREYNTENIHIKNCRKQEETAHAKRWKDEMTEILNLPLYETNRGALPRRLFVSSTLKSI